MNERASTSRRRRPTREVDAERRAGAIADNLGRDVRATRRRLHLTQTALAERVGVHQTWISRIEHGRGAGVSLAAWVAIGVALDRPLAVSLSKPTHAEIRLADAGHLDIQEALAALATATGRHVSIERPSRPDVASHSTDVAFRDVPNRTLILAEAWNTISDLGVAIRSTHRKQAEATATLDLAELDRVATVWVVRDAPPNRAIVARYPHLLAATFTGSSRRWVAAVVGGAPAPNEPGFVWFDPATRRIAAWHRTHRAGTMHP